MHVSNFIISHEVLMRLGGVFGILGIMSLWEMIAPGRALTISKPLRWINNIGIVFLNSFLLRIIFPSAAVGVATFAQKHGWGFFYYLQVSYTFAVLSSIIAMDFFIYLQHVMFHAVPVFMIIGLREFRDVRQSTTLPRMLAIPFVGKT